MNGEVEKNDAKAIDMRVFAKSAGANIRFGVGNIISTAATPDNACISSSPARSR